MDSRYKVEHIRQQVHDRLSISGRPINETGRIPRVLRILGWEMEPRGVSNMIEILSSLVIIIIKATTNAGKLVAQDEE